MAEVFSSAEDRAEWELARHALKEVRFNLDADLHRRLRVIAAEKDLSLAEVVRRLVSAWVTKQEAERG